jgi:hypothetical protein
MPHERTARTGGALRKGAEGVKLMTPRRSGQIKSKAVEAMKELGYDPDGAHIEGVGRVMADYPTPTS